MSLPWSSIFSALWKPLYFNVQLDITNACNLRCSHCYHSHHRNDGALSLEQWLEVLSRIKAFSKRTRMTPKLILCGGEPLTSPLLIPIANAWKDLFPTSPKYLLTNGTLLLKPMVWDSGNGTGSTWAEWIQKNQFSVQVSLDGPDSNSHDEIRGTGNFKRTLQGILRLVELGVEVNLLAVLSRTSSKSIADFFSLAKSLGVRAMNFERMIPLGTASRLTEERLIGFDLKAALESILHHSKDTGVRTSTQRELWAAIDPALGTADSLGFYDWIVDYQGNLKFSSRTDGKIGNALTDDPLELLLSHPVLRALRERKISGCVECSLFKELKCSGNRNMAYALTGDYLAADPDCWRLGGEDEKESLRSRGDDFDHHSLSSRIEYAQ